MSEDTIDRLSFAILVLSLFIFYFAAFVGYLNREDYFSALIALALGFIILFLGMLVNLVYQISSHFSEHKEVRKNVDHK